MNRARRGRSPVTVVPVIVNFGPDFRLGAGIVMLGSERDDDFGAINQGIYICLREVDDHCARARAAGAEIVREPFDTDYGSWDYIARDPEGNLWAFGTYNPLEVAA
jgi:uncharacterized glyoxalase superfamily protein PhnB